MTQTPETKNPTRAEALADFPFVCFNRDTEEYECKTDEAAKWFVTHHKEILTALKALSATDAPIVEGRIDSTLPFEMKRHNGRPHLFFDAGGDREPSTVEIALWNRLYAQGRTQSAELDASKLWYAYELLKPLIIRREDFANSDSGLMACVNVHNAFNQIEQYLSAAPPVTGGAWLPIESAPKHEATSYLVWVPKRKGIDEYDSIIQVSNFQGDMYPDNKQCCVDWGDRIEGATHWQPLPAPPSSAEKG